MIKKRKIGDGKLHDYTWKKSKNRLFLYTDHPNFSEKWAKMSCQVWDAGLNSRKRVVIVK